MNIPDALHFTLQGEYDTYVTCAVQEKADGQIVVSFGKVLTKPLRSWEDMLHIESDCAEALRSLHQGGNSDLWDKRHPLYCAVLCPNGQWDTLRTFVRTWDERQGKWLSRRATMDDAGVMFAFLRAVPVAPELQEQIPDDLFTMKRWVTFDYRAAIENGRTPEQAAEYAVKEAEWNAGLDAAMKKLAAEKAG